MNAVKDPKKKAKVGKVTHLNVSLYNVHMHTRMHTHTHTIILCSCCVCTETRTERRNAYPRAEAWQDKSKVLMYTLVT